MGCVYIYIILFIIVWGPQNDKISGSLWQNDIPEIGMAIAIGRPEVSLNMASLRKILRFL